MKSNIYTNRTASNASIIASSDQGVGFDRDNSIPSRLQRPYNVPFSGKEKREREMINKFNIEILINIQRILPVGIPNSEDAF